MDIDCLIRFCCSVAAILLDPSRIEEIARAESLLDGDDIAWVWVGRDNHLHSLTQTRKLIAHISDSSKGFKLQEILETPPATNRRDQLRLVYEQGRKVLTVGSNLSRSIVPRYSGR